MGVIRQRVDRLFEWFSRHQGPVRLDTIDRCQELQEYLIAYAIAGYEIRLYCQKKQYSRHSGIWGVPALCYQTFRVFSRVTSDAPEALRRACELDLDLPRMTPYFVSETAQKDMAVRAYLDLLIERLNAHRRYKYHATRI